MITETKEAQLQLKQEQRMYAGRDGSPLVVGGRARGGAPFFPSAVSVEGGDGGADADDDYGAGDFPECEAAMDEIMLMDAKCDVMMECEEEAYIEEEQDQCMGDICEKEYEPMEKRRRRMRSVRLEDEYVLPCKPKAPPAPEPAPDLKLMAEQERQREQEREKERERLREKEKEWEEARRLDKEEDERKLNEPHKEVEEMEMVLEEDVTQLPGRLDKRYEELDTDSALRPTIINPGKVWTKKFQRTLLSNPDGKHLCYICQFSFWL